MSNSQIENFEYIARLKFASRLRYSTDHNPEDLLGENYFKNSAAQYLERGDEIDVVCHAEDGSWTKGVLEVVKTDRSNTVVQVLQPWRSSSKKPARKMEAVHKGFGKWSVFDEHGVEVAKNLAKAEATEMAPEKKKAKV